MKRTPPTTHSNQSHAGEHAMTRKLRRAAHRALRLERVTADQRIYVQRKDGHLVAFHADVFIVGLVFAGDLDLANAILDVLERGKSPVIESSGPDGEYRLWDARVVPMQRGGAA